MNDKEKLDLMIDGLRSRIAQREQEIAGMREQIQSLLLQRTSTPSGKKRERSAHRAKKQATKGPWTPERRKRFSETMKRKNAEKKRQREEQLTQAGEHNPFDNAPTIEHAVSGVSASETNDFQG